MQRTGNLDKYPKYKGRITVCSRCGEIKHVYSREMCKECYSKWYRNQDYVKERAKEYEEKRRTRSDYRERKREKNKRYYQRNRDKIRAYKYIWSRKNPQSHREAGRRRRARKAKTECSLTENEWNILLEIFNYRCAYCDEKGESLEKEHWIPLIKGGVYSITNIVPSCRGCNASKGTLNGNEFIEKQERLKNGMAQG